MAHVVAKFAVYIHDYVTWIEEGPDWPPSAINSDINCVVSI